MTPPQVVGRGPQGAARCLLSKHRKPAHKCVCSPPLPWKQRGWAAGVLLALRSGDSQARCCAARGSVSGPSSNSRIELPRCSEGFVPLCLFPWQEHIAKSCLLLACEEKWCESSSCSFKKKKKKVLSSENCILPLLGREGQLPEASSCLAVKWLLPGQDPCGCCYHPSVNFWISLWPVWAEERF